MGPAGTPDYVEFSGVRTKRINFSFIGKAQLDVIKDYEQEASFSAIMANTQIASMKHASCS